MLFLVALLTALAQPAKSTNYFPRLVDVVLPVAPGGAGPRAFALVGIDVGPDGGVRHVEVLHSSGDAAQPIVAAVSQWVFDPLIRDGPPVASRVKVHLGLVTRAAPGRSPEDEIRALVNAAAEIALPPNERLALLEERFAEWPAAGRASLPSSMAKVAFNAGEFTKARTYATLALDGAIDPKVWHYGDAIYDGHMILGRLAVRDGELDQARRHLLDAGRAPGSPSLNSFGPNVSLARDLLARGERETVLQFFEFCRNFWKRGPERLDAWSATVRQGGVPDFGANLSY